jgi:hypothetical protein
MLVLCAGTLLSSCSQSTPETTTGTQAAARPASPEFPFGGKVDSLNGIPGHQFGEPLSAFPGIELAKTQNPGTRTYTYPDNKPAPGWFGKHKKDVPFVFYVFKDDKFIAFQAIAMGAGRQALQEQALFLFGPGKKYPAGTSWNGEKALAYYTPRLLPNGPAEILDVQSVEGNKAQAAATAERLKKENAL